MPPIVFIYLFVGKVFRMDMNRTERNDPDPTSKSKIRNPNVEANHIPGDICICMVLLVGLLFVGIVWYGN